MGQYQAGSTPPSSTSGNSAREYIVADRARLLLAKSDYAGVIRLLECRPCISKMDDFTQNLMLAECYLYTEEGNKAAKMIDDVKTVLLTSSDLSIDDVMGYANDLTDGQCFTRAIILLRLAGDMYMNKASSSPDDVINGVHSCVQLISRAVGRMSEFGGRTQAVGLEVGSDISSGIKLVQAGASPSRFHSKIHVCGVQFMKEMYGCIEAVRNGNAANKALKLAWCAGYLGYDYIQAGEQEKSMEIRQAGIQILENQFGAEASNYLIYGYMLHNFGVAYFNKAQYLEAKSLYERAIEARREATDYLTGDERQRDINVSRENYEQTLQKLQNQS